MQVELRVLEGVGHFEHLDPATSAVAAMRTASGRPLGALSREPGPLVAAPQLQQAPEVRHELLVLVRRELRRDGVDEQRVELGALEVGERDLVDVGEPAGAEVLVAVGLEVGVGQGAVGSQLLVVPEVVTVGDGEPRRWVDVRVGLTSRLPCRRPTT